MAAKMKTKPSKSEDVFANAENLPDISADNVVIEKSLVMPGLKLNEGIPILVRIETEITVSTRAQKKDKDGVARKPPMVGYVTALNTDAKAGTVRGTRYEMIFPKVLHSTLTESPDPYVGKCFRITKGEKKSGPNGNYSLFTVDRLKV